MVILDNARIYTMNSLKPWASTIAYEDDRIVYVGNNWEGEGEKVDMSGKFILPGLIDSHIHPASCCTSSWHIRLPQTDDLSKLLKFIEEFVEKHPKEKSPFLYFEYYPTSMFDEKGPSKELLDKVVNDRPCLCQDFGEHLCWINSKMLELLRVDKSTPNPTELAIFVRDSEGNPTGWVKENAWKFFAENMYDSLGWHPPERLDATTMEPFFKFLSQIGITAIFDGFIENEKHIKAIYDLDKEGLLNIYYDGSVRFEKFEDLPEAIEQLRKYQKFYTTRHIKINTVKLFLDGTNESGNSASLHGHVNDPENYGIIAMEEDELAECLMLCNREGLDIHIHMVGDRAFRVGCNAVEKAQAKTRESGGIWCCRPVFAHCEVVDPQDMERPAKLGIAVNWSCHWSGGYFGEEALKYYTEEKWKRMYQFNQMIYSGADIAFSSDVVTDYELHRAYPFFGMQVAATRVDPEFPLNSSRYPESIRPEKHARIRLENLIRGYTIAGARQLGWEKEMGTLEKGKLANMVILKENIFDLPIEELKDVSIENVIFEGKNIEGTL